MVSPVQRVELERIAQQSRSARSAAFRARIICSAPVEPAMRQLRQSCAPLRLQSACGATVSLPKVLPDWG